MKRINKIFVILPILLMFVISSIPVMAWPEQTVPVTINYPEYGKVTYYVKTGSYPEAQYKDQYGLTNVELLLKDFMSGTNLADLYARKGITLTQEGIDAITAFRTAYNGALTQAEKETVLGKGLTLSFAKSKGSGVNVAAVDYYTRHLVNSSIYYMENKYNANSYYDLAHEFYAWERAVGNPISGYHFIGFAPDVNNRVTPYEQEILDKLGVDMLVWVARKNQPMPIAHVFPNGQKLYETTYVDYWALNRGLINNYNAPAIAPTRIQSMNNFYYTPSYIGYNPLVIRESIIENAYDAYGNRIEPNVVMSYPGIVIRYDGVSRWGY